jgi:hypothetical protein
MTFRKFNDPSHGWVRVRRVELSRLGILDKISKYSYQNNNFVYLEEDSDWPRFVNAYIDKHNVKPIVKNQETSNCESKIRTYSQYEMRQV